jgi:hypothetical protein
MDTDFVYEYFSQNPDAVASLNERVDAFFIIGFTTAAELFKTTYNKEKLDKLNSAFRKSNLEILHIDEDISEKALQLIQEFQLSHAFAISFEWIFNQQNSIL